MPLGSCTSISAATCCSSSKTDSKRKASPTIKVTLLPPSRKDHRGPRLRNIQVSTGQGSSGPPGADGSECTKRSVPKAGSLIDHEAGLRLNGKTALSHRDDPKKGVLPRILPSLALRSHSREPRHPCPVCRTNLSYNHHEQCTRAVHCLCLRAQLHAISPVARVRALCHGALPNQSGQFRGGRPTVRPRKTHLIKKKRAQPSPYLQFATSTPIQLERVENLAGDRPRQRILTAI